MQILTAEDAKRYLEDNWSGNSGGPIRTIEGLLGHNGYFEAPHLLMTYIEFLTGLFTGKGPATVYSDIRIFMDQYFPAIYKRAGAWLIYQYRHGFAHQYAPKVIRLDSSRVLGWYCSLDPAETADHLIIKPGTDPGSYHLRVNAVQFLRDFKDAVARFSEDVSKDPSRFRCFKAGYTAYQAAEDLGQINRPYVTLVDKDWFRNNATP
jgi:hypothetical protein